MSLYIERVPPASLTGDGNRNDRVGSVDDNGQVYDMALTRVGSVGSAGTICDADHQQVGWVDRDGDIYDACDRRVASVDQGRIYQAGSGRWLGAIDGEGRNRSSDWWLQKAGGAGLLLLINPAMRRQRAALGHRR